MKLAFSCPAQLLFAYIKLSTDQNILIQTQGEELCNGERVINLILLVSGIMQIQAKFLKASSLKCTYLNKNTMCLISVFISNGWQMLQILKTFPKHTAGPHPVSLTALNTLSHAFLWTDSVSQLCVPRLPEALKSPNHHKHTLLQGDVCMTVAVQSVKLPTPYG